MTNLISRFNYNHTTPLDGYVPNRNNLEDYNPFMKFED